MRAFILIAIFTAACGTEVVEVDGATACDAPPNPRGHDVYLHDIVDEIVLTVRDRGLEQTQHLEAVVFELPETGDAWVLEARE